MGAEEVLKIIINYYLSVCSILVLGAGTGFLVLGAGTGFLVLGAGTGLSLNSSGGRIMLFS